jgi:hypothetical protein
MKAFEGLTKNQLNMRAQGLLLMIFVAIDIVDGICGILDPSWADGYNDLFVQLSGQSAQSTVFGFLLASIILLIVLEAIQFYFGWIGYRLRPTKLAANVCLIVAILDAVSVICDIVMDGFTISMATTAVAMVVSVCYWYCARKLLADYQ